MISLGTKGPFWVVPIFVSVLFLRERRTSVPNLNAQLTQ